MLVSIDKASQEKKKVEFRDIEVMTIMLAMDFIPFPSERQFVEYVCANYVALFPKLLEQSQVNRRAMAISPLLEKFSQHWLLRLGIVLGNQGLLNTKPVPVVGYRRSKRHSDFQGSAANGYCVSKKMCYFGYKLVAICTLEGFPLSYDLVPANTDERKAAETLLKKLTGFSLLADKGFLSEDWQVDIFQFTGNQIWTLKRKNQVKQQPKDLERWINGLQLRIEGIFNEVQNIGKNVEHLLAKIVVSLCSRIVAKMTSYLLKYILRLEFGIDVLTFSKTHA
jgi:hypothetical protein